MSRQTWFTTPNPQRLISEVDQMSRSEASRFFCLQEGNFPRYLYKFNPATDIRALRGTIVSSTVWLSSPLKFNDPFDLRAKIVLLGTHSEQVAYVAKNFRKKGLSSSPDDARITAEAVIGNGSFLKIIQAEFEKNAVQIGVCCFASKRSDEPRSGARDILMWSHYGRDHTGICFQFHTVRSPAFFAQTRAVRYKDELTTIDWRDSGSRGNRIYDAIFTKADVWSHEGEVRISLPDTADSPQSFKPNALTGIIFGCRANQETTDKVVALCRERVALGLPSIRLFRARQSDRSYRITIESAGDLESQVSAS